MARPKDACSSSIVLQAEDCCVLRYPPSFGVTLVEEVYGLNKTPATSSCLSTEHKTVVGEFDSECEQPKAGRRRKRVKVDRILNQGERLQREYHLTIKDRLLKCHTSLITLSRACGYLPADKQPNVFATRESSIDLASLCELDALVPLTNTAEEVLTCEGHHATNVDVFGKMITNTASTTVTIDALGRHFVIPADSSFIVSDFSKMVQFFSTADFLRDKYNLIVVDPPWENRSAIRSKRYHWLPMEKLVELPVARVAADGALIAVWVTNKKKFAQFVVDTLFPAWGVKPIAEWHWIKVTTEGNLVIDMESQHKKPYEIVIIGKKDVDCQTRTTKCGQDYNDDYFPPCKKKRTDSTGAMKDSIVIPCQKFFMCIPSTNHSQKPFIGELLSQYIIENPCCLELFARNLLPGWTAWGNEVLKYQECVE